MKRLLLAIAIVLWASTGWTATYYVTQSGSGGADGTSYADSASVAYFNAGTGVFAALDDDTVYLCGTITSRVIIPDGGTAGHVVTIRGDYGPEPPERVDIDIAGTGGSSSRNGLQATQKHYLVIDGIRISDAGYAGISLIDCNYPTVQNCYITKAYEHGLVIGLSASTTGPLGAWTTNIVGAVVDNNEFYECGYLGTSAQTDVVFSYVNGFTFTNNTCHGVAGSDWGVAGLWVVNCKNGVVKYNEIYSHMASTRSEGAVAFKGDGWTTSDIEFAYNYIHDETYHYWTSGGEADGIYLWGSQNNIQVHHNFIADIFRWGINVGTYSSDRTSTNIDIYGNVVVRCGLAGIAISGSGSQTGINIFNNTVSSCGDTYATSGLPNGSYGSGGIAIMGSSSYATVKNNILYDNLGRTGTDYWAIVFRDYGKVTFDYNRYYHASTATIGYFNGSSTTPISFATWQGAPYNQEANGAEGDPGFADGPNDDYTLTSVSGCRNTGLDLTSLGAKFVQALDGAATDFTTSPPTAVTVSQNDEGLWEKGAYIYDEAGITYPQSAIDTAGNPHTISVGGSVAWTGTASSGSGSGYTYSWEKAGVEFSTSEDPGATVYNTAGTYAITLTVCDGASNCDPTPASQTVTVNPIGADTSHILFWWRGESDNFSGTNDCTAVTGGPDCATTDDIGILVSGAAINVDANKTGTKGLDVPTAGDSIYFYNATDLNDVNDDEGRVGFWMYPVTIVNTVQIFGFYYDNASNLMYLAWDVNGTNEILFHWENQGTTEEYSTTSSGIATGSWYFIEAAWKTSTNYRQMWVNGVPKGTSSATIGNFTGDPKYLYWGQLLAAPVGATDEYFDQIMAISDDSTTDFYAWSSATSFPPVDPDPDPVFTSWTCATADGTYTTGSIGTITGTASETMTLCDDGADCATPWAGNMPFITVQLNGRTLNLAATAVSGAEVTFEGFALASGDWTNDLDVIALDLNGGDIKDADDNSVSTTIPTGTDASSLASNKDIKIYYAGDEPTTVSVIGYDADYCSTCSADDTYTSGVVYFGLKWNQHMNTVSTEGDFPKIELALGPYSINHNSYASYVNRVSSNTFRLGIDLLPGMRSVDLDYASRDLVRGDSTVTDLGDNAWTTETDWLPAISGGYSLSDNAALVVACPSTESYPIEIGTGGDYPFWANGSTGFEDLSYGLEFDYYQLVAAITDDVNTSVAGGSGTECTLDGAGVASGITGAVTLDQNYWIVRETEIVGDVTLSATSPELRNTRVIGDVYVNTATATINNCTIAGQVISTTNYVMNNSIVWKVGGAELDYGGGGVPTLNYAYFEQADPGAGVTDTGCVWEGADPFADLGGGNYRLSRSSAARNLGQVAITYTEDFDQAVRTRGTYPDAGYAERQLVVVINGYTPSAINGIGVGDLSAWNGVPSTSAP